MRGDPGGILCRAQCELSTQSMHSLGGGLKARAPLVPLDLHAHTGAWDASWLVVLEQRADPWLLPHKACLITLIFGLVTRRAGMGARRRQTEAHARTHLNPMRVVLQSSLVYERRHNPAHKVRRVLILWEQVAGRACGRQRVHRKEQLAWSVRAQMRPRLAPGSPCTATPQQHSLIVCTGTHTHQRGTPLRSA